MSTSPRNLRSMNSANLDTLDTSLAVLAERPEPRFLLFKGRFISHKHTSPARHLPPLLNPSALSHYTKTADWCSDCQRTVGAIRAAIATSGGSCLEVSIGDLSDWKSPSHPFKQQPAAASHDHDHSFGLTAIPTLLLWHCDADGTDGLGTGGDRLDKELEKCKDGSEAFAITEDFIKRHQSHN